MNSAVRHARKADLEFTIHEFEPVEDTKGSVEAAAFVGGEPERIFKTLIVKLDGRRLAMAILLLNAQLDLKALAKTASAKKAAMAPAGEAERATGYLIGGISPLGQRRQLPAFLDASAMEHATIFVSGGRRGLELELAPAALAEACGASMVALAR